MTSVLRLSLLLSSLVLMSCASQPVHYYTLLTPASQEGAQSAPVPFLIDVLPVGIPAQLDQPQLTVRQGAGGIAVLNGERWAAPLSDEVHTALIAQLTDRLHTQDVGGLTHPSDRPVMKIKLQIRRFDAWVGRNVQLEADWSMAFAEGLGGPHALVCRSRFDEMAPGGYPELVRAQQQAVTDLAIRIASAARAWRRCSDSSCSTP